MQKFFVVGGGTKSVTTPAPPTIFIVHQDSYDKYSHHQQETDI